MANKVVLLVTVALCLLIAGTNVHASAKRRACNLMKGVARSMGVDTCKWRLADVTRAAKEADKYPCFPEVRNATLQYMLDEALETRRELDNEGISRWELVRRNRANRLCGFDVDFEYLDIIDFGDETGLNMEMQRNSTMLEVIEGLRAEFGTCWRCRDDGCLRVNFWLAKKKMMIKRIVGMIEDDQICNKTMIGN